jgi:hypothetical protein
MSVAGLGEMEKNRHPVVASEVWVKCSCLSMVGEPRFFHRKVLLSFTSSFQRAIWTCTLADLHSYTIGLILLSARKKNCTDDGNAPKSNRRELYQSALDFLIDGLHDSPKHILDFGYRPTASLLSPRQ